jgi:hypothetical protein
VVFFLSAPLLFAEVFCSPRLTLSHIALATTAVLCKQPSRCVSANSPPAAC